MKIEFSPKQLISWLLSTLATLLVTLIFSKPLSLAVDWFGQWVPEFLSNFYVVLLASSLLFNINLMIFSSLLLSIVLFDLCLAQVFHKIIKGYFRNKQSSLSPDISNSPRTFLIIMSIGVFIGFLCILHFSSLLQDNYRFEYKLIILSSKLTSNEIGTYKTQWLQMKTAKDFKDLNNAMEQDAKKHHLKFK